MVTRQEITLPETAARGLRRWMRAVGGFYVLMGVFNTPPIIQDAGAVPSPRRPGRQLRYDPVVYSICIVVHLVIITTGVLAIRRSRS